MQGGLIQNNAPQPTGVPPATVTSLTDGGRLQQSQAQMQSQQQNQNIQTVETRDNAVANIFEGTGYTRDDAAFLLNAITTGLLIYAIALGGFE